MVSINEIRRIQEEERQKRLAVYSQVEKIRKNETSEDKWRRKIAGLEWITDFLLESNAQISHCLYDGRRLRRAECYGNVHLGEGGYNLGFEVPMDKLPQIHFSIYCLELNEKHKQLMQCPDCKLVYCLPQIIDIRTLRKQNQPRYTIPV